ncbi:MAG: T9SS type A sorting domain-containing protein [Bacteroidetes bacterium]|nr:T9SS type A sorting domain-containing protein [Bacteroidota bacterium]
MKKILFPLLFLFFAASFLFAQQSNPASFAGMFLKKHSQHDLSKQKKISSLKSQLPVINTVWKPARYIDWNWDTTGNSWLYADSVHASYNTNSDITQEDYYFSNPFPEQRITYTYTATHKLLNMLTQWWNGTSWDNSYQEVYTYNGNDLMTQDLSQTWNTSTSAWDNQNQYLYTYNANNKMTQEIGQGWNATTSEWDNWFKMDLTYNGNQQDIQETYSSWNTTTNVWDYSDKVDLKYNTGGVLKIATVELWNTSTSAWDSTDYYPNITWHYWSGDYRTSTWQSDTVLSWNGSGWDLSWRDTYTYDAKNNQTDYKEETYSNPNWTISYEYSFSYLYDANNNITQLIQQDWDPNKNTIVNYHKRDYFDYSPYSAVAEINSDDGIFIYPNPSSGQFTVSGLQSAVQITVYNLVGEAAYQTTVNSKQQTVNLNAASGIYLLRMSTSEGAVSKKIILER